MEPPLARAAQRLSLTSRCLSLRYYIHYLSHLRAVLPGDAMSKAKVWDVSTGLLKQTMDCGGWVYVVYFSGDGSVLATGDQGKTARLWSVATGKQVYCLHCSDEVSSKANGKQRNKTSGKGSSKAELSTVHRILTPTPELTPKPTPNCTPAPTPTPTPTPHALPYPLVAPKVNTLDLSRDKTLLTIGEKSGKVSQWRTAPGHFTYLLTACLSGAPLQATSGNAYHATHSPHPLRMLYTLHYTSVLLPTYSTH